VALSTASNDVPAFRRIEDSGIPVLFFDKVPEAQGFRKVCVADADAGTLAAQAIIRKKSKKALAIFGNPALSITQKRLEAFSEEFKKSAPDTKLSIVNTGNSE
jgi:LacI family transcriptional regulator